MRLTVLSISLALAWPVAAAFVYEPSSGNVATVAPFAYDLTGLTGMRYQQVYGAPAFSTIGPDGGWITAIAFSFADSSQGGGTIEAQINLSTTSRAVDGLSTVFADNVGADNRVVIGPGTLSFFRNEDQFSSMSIRLDLVTPFYYNPATGNLLMDVRLNRGYSGFPGTASSLLDASNSGGDQSSRVYAFSSASATGIADSIGLVTRFTVTPVPEPSTVVLIVVSLITFSIFGLRKKQNRKE